MKRVFWGGLPYRCGPIWGMFIITLSPLDVLACPHLGETDPPKILSVIFLGFSPRCGQAITSRGKLLLSKFLVLLLLVVLVHGAGGACGAGGAGALCW